MPFNAERALTFSSGVRVVESSICLLYLTPETPVAEITEPFTTFASLDLVRIASAL